MRERGRRLRILVPAIFIAMGKRETPLAAKVLAAITVVYALSPIDLIPDFIPVLGYLDDLIILPALAAITIRLIPHPLMEQCLRESEGLWKSGKPKRWYFALPLVAIQAALLWWIGSLMFGKNGGGTPRR